MDETVFRVQLATPFAPGEETVLLIDFEVIIPEVVKVSSMSEKWYYQDIFILRHVWYPVEVARTAETGLKSLFSPPIFWTTLR